MEAVRHHPPRGHLPARFLARLAEAVEKRQLGTIVSKERGTIVAAIDDLIDRALELESELACYGPAIRQTSFQRSTTNRKALLLDWPGMDR